MVDYSFEGTPLLKQFPAIGYEELEYDYLER
jgi:NADH:ubiquinone oxidoreductase subunit C